MTGGKAKTGGANVFSKASIRLAFQKRPGSGAVHRIKDGGPATVIFRSGKTIVLTPSDGVYSLEVSKGDSAVLEIFSTQFSVHALASGDPDPGGIVAWRSPLLPKNTLKGVQQRLQILGYYTGRVDGAMGAKTERAVLEFQADEGSLKIDGEAGPKTQAALDATIEKNGKDSTGKHYLIRRYLLRFERAKIGEVSASCPHPDYRGSDDAVVSYGYSVIKSWADRDGGPAQTGQPFHVGTVFEALSTAGDVTLLPKFRKKPDFAQVMFEERSASFQLKHGYSHPHLTFVPKVKNGEDVLDLFYKSDKGPVLASLSVKISEMKQVMVAVHLLTITDATGRSVPPWTRAEALGLMALVNAVWIPMGVEFSIVDVISGPFQGVEAGTITDDYSGTKGGRKEHEEIWKNLNLPDRINVYFCERLVDYDTDNGTVLKNTSTLGYAISRKAMVSAGRPVEPIGACVKKDPDLFNLALTVAHELGHVLNLTCHLHAHADDDGTDLPFRHDIWSRTRLMAKYSQYELSNPPRLWQDSTYGRPGAGKLQCGAWLTVKKLAQDGTDNELSDSRNAAVRPY